MFYFVKNYGIFIYFIWIVRKFIYLMGIGWYLDFIFLKSIVVFYIYI